MLSHKPNMWIKNNKIMVLL